MYFSFVSAYAYKMLGYCYFRCFPLLFDRNFFLKILLGYKLCYISSSLSLTELINIRSCSWSHFTKSLLHFITSTILKNNFANYISLNGFLKGKLTLWTSFYDLEKLHVFFFFNRYHCCLNFSWKISSNKRLS